MATKKEAPKAAAKPAAKAAAKPAAKTTAKAVAPKVKASAPKNAKAGGAFAKPLTPSKQLAAVVGATPLPRTEVVSKVWEYIKKHKLQNEANKREIVADDKLKAVFDKDKVTMFEMNKYLAKHLS